LNRVSEIRTVVANANGLRPQDLLKGRRSPKIAEARQVAMLLARETTHLSLTGIASAFGVNHHTTVLHAARRVSQRAERDEAFARSLDVLRSQLPQTRWRERFRNEICAAHAVGEFLASVGASISAAPA
jgi:chromosomal replication initiator protein